LFSVDCEPYAVVGP